MRHIGILAIFMAALGATAHLNPQSETSNTFSPVDSGPAGPSVAVLNISRAFKECDYFKQSMAELRAEYEAEGDRIRRRTVEAELRAKALVEQIKELPSTSTEWKALERELATLRFGTEFSSPRREKVSPIRRESDIHLTVYHQLLTEVDRYCSEKGISIVLRASNKDIDPADPNTVLRAIEKDLAWYNPSVHDITDEVIRRLNVHFADSDTPASRVSDIE